MGNRVYVSNLPYSVTDLDVADFFGGSVGGVVEVVLMVDKETGRPRGFGFVQFKTDAQAQSAINNLNGAEMDGRDLRVSEAHERSGGGRGRSSGDGGRDVKDRRR
jgi:cold-inducible RNA-binding protein